MIAFRAKDDDRRKGARRFAIDYRDWILDANLLENRSFRAERGKKRRYGDTGKGKYSVPGDGWMDSKLDGERLKLRFSMVANESWCILV